MGSSPYTGSLIVTAIKSVTIAEPFEDPFVGEIIRAQGKFIGVRFKFKSELSSAFQPSTVIFDNMQLTDGEQSWAVSDYNGIHTGAPSWAWSANQGDEQGATDVGAGFESFTWALFDVPTSAQPHAIAYQSEDEQYCLEIPT